MREHEVLWGECLAGALYTGDFARICRDVGFTDPRVLSSDPVAVTDPELKAVVGNASMSPVCVCVCAALRLLSPHLMLLAI